MILRNFLNTLRSHKATELEPRAAEPEILFMNERMNVFYGETLRQTTPVAYFITGRWLEQFAHRISVPLWVFPASLALVLAVTITLVTLRSLRSARTNPAETLKKE